MFNNLSAKTLIFPEPFQPFIDTDTYLRFLHEQCQQPNHEFAVFTFPHFRNDLSANIFGNDTDNDFRYYWEKPFEKFTIAARGIVKKISHCGSNRFRNTYADIVATNEKIAQFITSSHLRSNALFLGGFSFFDELNDPKWKNFGAASFVLPRCTVIRKNGQTTITIALSLKGNRTPEKLHAQLVDELRQIEETDSRDEVTHQASANGNGAGNFNTAINKQQYKNWIKSVNNARQSIADKNLEKVVLARQLKLPKPAGFPPERLVGYLRQHYPKCCTFMIRMGGSKAFVGCSPEQLLSFRGRSLRTEALAGSIARGEDKKDDRRLQNRLLNSKKNETEHRYVVQSIEQDLTAFACDLKKSEQPVIKKLANVQHLCTPIKALMRENTDPLTILGQLHPTPAVGGYPRDKAVEYIRENEPVSRGWFASPVGWINTDGSGEFTVAIRSGLIGSESALLFAGCGIIADSDPEAEWHETILKLMPMLSALHYD